MTLPGEAGGPGLLTRSRLLALMAEHGVRPSRALGQNFVADPNTVRRIARLAQVGPGDRVVEIGAGAGSLTLALADTGAEVIAVEVDRRLVPILRRLAEPAGVRVVEGDATHLDWAQLLAGGPVAGLSGRGPVAAGGLSGRGPVAGGGLSGRGPVAGGGVSGRGPVAGGWVLVANLPYNVATPLVADLLDTVPAIDRMLVMVQRQVGERLAAGAGEEAYGAVSVKVAYWAEAQVVGRVPPSVFVPRPRVESVLVAVRRRPSPAVDPSVVAPAELFSLVRAGFAQRRKMLRRALAGRVADAAWGVAGVAPDARAEDLDVQAWGRLAGAAGSAAGAAAAGARVAGAPAGAGVAGAGAGSGAAAGPPAGAAAGGPAAT